MQETEVTICLLVSALINKFQLLYPVGKIDLNYIYLHKCAHKSTKIDAAYLWTAVHCTILSIQGNILCLIQQK